MKSGGGYGLRAGRAVVALAPFAAYALFGPTLHEARATGTLAGGGTVTIAAIERDPAKALDRSRRALDSAFERAANAATKSETTQRYLDNLARLADVIAAEPPAPAPAPSAEPPAPRRPEPERIKLELERATLSAELASHGGASSPGDSSDNPFSDGQASTPTDTVLRRRIAEIDRLLSVATNQRRPPPRAVVGAEVASLVRTLPSAVPTSEASGPSGTAGDVQTARLAPDRTWVLTLGLFAALGAALLPVGRRRSADAVRSAPSRGAWEPTSAPPTTPVPRAQPSDRPPRVSSRPPAPALGSSERPPASHQQPSSAPPPRPPQDESPVMAYPVAWRGASAADLARYAPLRNEVRSRATRECFVVAVSGSSTASEMKPAVAAGLSAALAEAPDSRVLLVEADLQRPRVCEVLGVAMIPAADFVSQLEARIAGSSDRHIYVLKCSPSLHVLPARAESPTLILSTHFESCLSALRPFYDVIVLDAPALEDIVACRAVNDVVDGVALVGRPPGAERAPLEHPFFEKSWIADVPPSIS